MLNAWLARLLSRPAPRSNARALRPPVIVGVDPALQGFQRAAARVVLQALGVARMPDRLELLTGTNDLRYAFSAFSRELGVNLDDLLNPDKPEHSRALARFHSCLALLARISSEAAETSLDAGPLYPLLSRPLERAEATLAQFRKAAALYRTIDSAAIPFPEFDAFRSKAKSRLQSWQGTSAAEMDSIFGVWSDFRSAKDLLDDLTSQLDELLEWFRRRAALHEDLAVLIQRMARDREMLVAQALAGVRRPDDALTELSKLLEALHVVAGHVRERGDPWSASDADGASRRAKACACLGISTAARSREIKAAYRRLAKRYHPDIAGLEAPTSTRFREISEAYHWLMNHPAGEEKEK